MTTSTRRIFSAGTGPRNARPTVSTDTRVSQSVARRAQRQLERTTERAVTRPALGGLGGTVQRLGAGAPLRPRADQGTGAVPVGSPVQYNQGIRTGQPFNGTTPAPTPQPIGWIQGEGDPNTANLVPRAGTRGDRYYDKESRTLWVWQQIDDETAEWVPVASGIDERTIGIPTPVAGNVYGLKLSAEARYLLISLSVINKTPTGGTATAGTGTVLVNGAEATMGTTIVEVGDFVGLRVDTVGADGSVLYGSVVAGLA